VPIGAIINPTAGTVTFGAYSLGAEPPGPDGGGVLVTFTMKALAEGQSTLDFIEAQISNRAGVSQTIGQMTAGQVAVEQTASSEYKIYLPLTIKE